MNLENSIKQLDASDMYGAIASFPDHLEEGWNLGATAAEWSLDANDFNGVVVCGMGGSAIGGDLVRTLVESSSPVPFYINRSYSLPSWVSKQSLVVVSSYSGGTEETLSAYTEARKRNATIVCITSGGTVLEIAQQKGHKYIVIPGGLQPRAALGYSFGPLLRIASEIGLVSVDHSGVGVSIAESRRRVQRLSGPNGSAAIELADDMRGNIPVIYSGVGLLEAVNLRWRTQIHENAKTMAYGNVFPELDHNEIMSLEAAPEDLRGRLAVITLRDKDDHSQVQRRMDITRDILSPGIGKWIDIDSEGDSKLGRMLSFIQLGDWVSFWLAMQLEVDPSPVGSIQQLKKMLVM